MKRLYWLAILMVVVLLSIAGFQVYWLKDNYNREQKALEVKAQVLFRETVREVQDSLIQNKFRLVLKDSSVTGLKKLSIDGKVVDRPASPRAARVLHILGEQMAVDSANRKKNVIITLNHSEKLRSKDSVETGRVVFKSKKPGTIDETIVIGAGKRLNGREKFKGDSQNLSWTRTRDHVKVRDDFTEISDIYFNTGQGEKVRVRIDSLFNDSIPLEEINKAFSKKLDEQELGISFEIVKRKQPELIMEEEDFVRRPAAFGNFEGYQLSIGNSFSYLIKKLSLPVLFSIFLVGLAVLSFVLLYRSLLRQHRLAEMKNDLVSNITHELKTPIATVGVAIEALKNFNAMQDPQRTKEYLDISQNELQRLSLLVDKVLKLSMFENREIAIKKELFDLEDVIREVVESLRLQLEKNKATIRVNAEGNLLIQGDRMHLLSVVFNLLDNSLKYNNGSVVITVDIKEENECVVLKITDNGIGIPLRYRKKIFEKFFRVPSGDTHNAKGHGLGLSYVAQVIRQHQGKIIVESQEGSGSSFIIELPKPSTSRSGRLIWII